MIITIMALIAIGKSRKGLVFKAIRDDVISVKASGINSMKNRMFALMISAFFTGLAGALFFLKNRQTV